MLASTIELTSFMTSDANPNYPKLSMKLIRRNMSNPVRRVGIMKKIIELISLTCSVVVYNPLRKL